MWARAPCSTAWSAASWRSSKTCPGVTRDRHYADAHVLGRDFVLIDTGGFDPESDDPMAANIADQVRLALEECELVICVLDGTTDPTPADREAVAMLRNSGKPTIYVANKTESKHGSQAAMGLYELGIDELLPVSALHGQGLGELDDAIAAGLPPLEPMGKTPEVEAPRVAIVGRPNAGKSSLVNRLLGEEQQIVDDRPGTTMDSIDWLFERTGKWARSVPKGEDTPDQTPWVLIDTAGMRRKRSVGRGMEALGVLSAIRSMERSDAVVLMIDADSGTAEQDAKVAGLAVERGRALVIGLNKADLLSGERRKKVIARTREILAFAPWAPVVTLSAKTGRGVNKLLDAVDLALESHRTRITTGETNRFFDEVLEHHPPPTMRNRPVRLYYVTQAQVKPPTFIAVTNDPQCVHWSYQRYVVNQIRKRFGFEGTPIIVRYRKKKRRGDEPR